MKGLLLDFCELGSLPGECPDRTYLGPDLRFQRLLHDPRSAAKHFTYVLAFQLQEASRAGFHLRKKPEPDSREKTLYVPSNYI